MRRSACRPYVYYVHVLIPVETVDRRTVPVAVLLLEEK